MSAKASGFPILLLFLCMFVVTLTPLHASFAGFDRSEESLSTHDAHEANPGVPDPFRHKIMSDLKGGIAEARTLLVRYGYAALFFTILVEGFGIPAPGQAILMAASIDAARGKLNIVWVLAFAIAAAVLGNTIGYVIGRWGGHPLLKKFKVQESRLARIELRFARNGRGVLLVARFFEGLRQLNGIVAGLLEMPWRRFTLWNTLGGVLWTGVWGLGVYFLGKKMIPVHLTFKRIEPVILVFTAAALATLLVYLLWQKRSKRS